jgi:ATP-dependent RNA helicase RhlB
VHRIGRTGRAGATGTSISFACEDDGFLLPEIEKLLDRKLTCEMPPVELLKALPEDITLLAEKAEQDSRRERRTQFGKTNRGGARSGSGSHSSSGPRSGGGLRGPGRTSGGNKRPTGNR